MPKHKAPTQVTIHHHEKSAFAEWVEKHWPKAAAVALVAIVGILGFQYMGSKATEREHAKWDILSRALREGEAKDLSNAANELAGTEVAGWAWAAAAVTAAGKREYGEAEAALTGIQGTNSKLLTQVRFPVGVDGAETTLAERMKLALESTRDFDQEHPDVFGNPTPSEGAPRVRIRTSAGDIVVALYQEEAPKHVANFLKLAKEGFYAGTKFHRVIPDFMIQGGDPNTKEGELDTWGQGGPGYKIDRETNDLVHERGALSAAKQPQEIQSSGSQFFLTVAPTYRLDGQHVVFGKVLEGMDVVDEIVGAEVREATSTIQDVPVNPVEITAVEVLGTEAIPEALPEED